MKSAKSDDGAFSIRTEDDVHVALSTDGVAAGGCRVHLTEPYNSISSFLTPAEARQLEDALRTIRERAEKEARESR